MTKILQEIKYLNTINSYYEYKNYNSSFRKKNYTFIN